MEKRRPLVQLAPVPTSRSDQILPENLVTHLGLLQRMSENNPASSAHRPAKPSNVHGAVDADLIDLHPGNIKKLAFPRHSPGTYETSDFLRMSVRSLGVTSKNLVSVGTPHECNLGLFGSASRSTACADRFSRANAYQNQMRLPKCSPQQLRTTLYFLWTSVRSLGAWHQKARLSAGTPKELTKLQIFHGRQ